MRTHIKIIYGLLQTIAFCLLISLITISDLVAGTQVGIDVTAFTIYSGAMFKTATASVREETKRKLNKGWPK